MVKAVTSFGRSGLSDWLIQRVSAVIITAYLAWLLFELACGSMTYEAWAGLFQLTCIRVFSTLALFSVVAHSWIGAWSILTDYVTPRFFRLELGIEIGQKAVVLRLLLEVFTVLLMLVFLIWGLAIIWGF
jgi:succinate dehydrogenase / fumarate reductase membrane anchor subunit